MTDATAPNTPKPTPWDRPRVPGANPAGDERTE